MIKNIWFSLIGPIYKLLRNELNLRNIFQVVINSSLHYSSSVGFTIPVNRMKRYLSRSVSANFNIIKFAVGATEEICMQVRT